jgi:hypothetical protein
MANDPYEELAKVAHLLSAEELRDAELLLRPTEREFLGSLPDAVLEAFYEAALAAEAAGRGSTFAEVALFLPADLQEPFRQALSLGYWS